MSIISSPLNFADLKAASVYYEILNCDPTKLRSIALEERFEKNIDGTMVYYNIFSNGGYARARGNCGEFVKMTTDDGREVFLHFSQVFGPTWAARQKMDTLAYVLGATYQNTHRQMAMLNDLINEAAALNESMRKFNDIYSSFAANALNYDSSAPNQRLKIEPWLLQLYIDNGLRFPLNRICSGLMPQLYISTFESGYIASNAGYGEYYPSVTWVIFFVRYDGKVINLWEGDPAATLAPPTRTLNECMQHPEIAAIFGDSEKFYKQFSATEKCSIGGKRAYYGKCVFDSSLNMIYKYFFGCSKDPVDDANLWKEATYIVNSNGEKRDVDVSAIGYSFSASLGEVFIGDKIGYFTQKEANAFLDQIRIAIDQLNNKLSVVSTTLGIYNQDLQQNYSVATSALDATEEAQQKTARNIR